MKPFNELTFLGRLRRKRQLAQTALGVYGLGEARFKLVVDAGNTLYRVIAPDHASAKTANGLFEEGQYLLRVHQPGVQATDAIELELTWMAAMRHEADLPIPEPVPTLDGSLLTQASIPGIPEERNCSLLHWVKGRRITKRLRPHHLRAQGQLMARLHNFSTHWQRPPGLTKRHHNWNGMFQDNPTADLSFSIDEVWALLPQSYVEPFKFVTQQMRQVMDELGQGPDVYGLIHADLAADANLLFWHGEPHVIDFDESGFGYWVYDLAVALEHCRETGEYARFRDALLEGYAESRSLLEEQLQHLELFTVALDVYLGLWNAGAAQFYPLYRETALRQLEHHAGHVVRYLADC
ncbi:MAG: phosphotransferase [Chloroflexi bacterium]|nr:phosphotransferase [Chloroflexota bacterium]